MSSYVASSSSLSPSSVVQPTDRPGLTASNIDAAAATTSTSIDRRESKLPAVNGACKYSSSSRHGQASLSRTATTRTAIASGNLLADNMDGRPGCTAPLPTPSPVADIDAFHAILCSPAAIAANHHHHHNDDDDEHAYLSPPSSTTSSPRNTTAQRQAMRQLYQLGAMDALCGMDAGLSDYDEEIGDAHIESIRHRVHPTASTLLSATIMPPAIAAPGKRLHAAPPIRPHRPSNRAALSDPPSSLASWPPPHRWKARLCESTAVHDSSARSNGSDDDDDDPDSDHDNDAGTSLSHAAKMSMSTEDISVITPWDVEPSMPPRPRPVSSVHTTRSSTSSTSLDQRPSRASFVWPRPMTWYRRTAFEPPYDPLFFGTWLCIAVIVAIFEAFTVRLLPSSVRVGFQIGFAGLVALALAAMLYTTLADTEDPAVREARRSGVQRDVHYLLQRGVSVRDNRGQCRVCLVPT
ncbi:hypothetical protein SYNPS1DRAFT_27716 [Syncephalis pseudoplumigaleata]|uniref:Uncharacterized protein n=1 Tax=Syncephalis pseudoplumigaleata TaxID=1712513 RepID=A0A4P9Z2L1_9FUNG|nr:hypothetical protein SYNPS1DRAFT_27716 [Syncephalis pseudoplumigaleata]|eukprot:RKP26598.1 hypothetical protein SYNPS1DRAFT_27716 [Syncephalis pseudoplumigaleata]